MGLVPALEDRGSIHPSNPEDFAMTRRRQHMAHELGHALGFEHNFIASVYGRTSVMDYPGPLVKQDSQGRLDLSEVFAEGTGIHDHFMVSYNYTPYDNPEAEINSLGKLVEDYLAEGYLMITSRDAALPAAYPEVLRWTEGSTQLEGLQRTLAVRQVLLAHFDQRAVKEGEALALLADRLTHVYLHHRFALEGSIKYLGGLRYTYALRGDGQQATELVSGQEQQQALDLILSALSPDALAIPERISQTIPPTPYGFDHEQRWIHSPTGTSFDPLSLAHVLANDVIGGILHPQRAARMISFHARDPETLSLDTVITALIEATWGQSASRGPEATLHAALLRITQRTLVERLLELADNKNTPAEARAVASFQLAQLQTRLSRQAGNTQEDRAIRLQARQDIETYLNHGRMPIMRSGVDQRARIIELPWY